MIAADLLVVATGVGTYFGVRGLTVGDAGAARENAHDVLAVEKELGLDIEAGVQDLLVDVEASPPSRTGSTSGVTGRSSPSPCCGSP